MTFQRPSKSHPFTINGNQLLQRATQQRLQIGIHWNPRVIVPEFGTLKTSIAR